MGVDQAPPDDDAELERLEREIVRETQTIDDLRNRTRVIGVEVAGWKAPEVRRGQSYFACGLLGFVFGAFAVAGLGKLIAAVIGR
jgi:hypothetical protein